MTKVATWNVNSIKVRLPHVIEWLQQEQVDILAIQETKSLDENFPLQAFEEIGYQAVFAGQKTYNGVAIVSKQAATEVLTDVPGLDDPQRRILVATIGSLRIVNLYVPNGQSVDSDKYQYKLDWLEKMTSFIREQLKHYPELIVLGDFNIAPEDRDVHDPIAWEGHVLVSEPERAAFQKFLQLGLHDSFRLFEQEEKSYSWWDYRQMAFRRNRGLRIDHVLISDALKNQCQACWVDKTPRKLERPSDHAPVVIEI